MKNSNRDATTYEITVTSTPRTGARYAKGGYVVVVALHFKNSWLAASEQVYSSRWLPEVKLAGAVATMRAQYPDAKLRGWIANPEH